MRRVTRVILGSRASIAVGAAVAAILVGAVTAAAAPALAPVHASGSSPDAVPTSVPRASQAAIPQVLPPRRAVPSAPPEARPLGSLHEADLLVTAARPLTAAALRRLRAVPGVQAVLPAALGGVVVNRQRVRALAADPSALRAWMPPVTARSDALWARVAASELAADYTLAHETRLPLGGMVAVGRGEMASRGVRLGAVASMQLPAVDIVVDEQLGSAFGLARGTAALVSAPHSDVLDLRDAVVAAVGGGVDVAVVRDPSTVRAAGEYLTQGQLHALLKAALSRVGAPYTWGATGPDRFDCSGLIGYAFAAAGIRLPRTSEQQWMSGVHVPPSSAQPGDLLFWTNDPMAPQDVDHVALYLGNGLMVSAPHTGDVVHVGPVPGAGFAGVVRVDPTTAARVGGPWWSAS